MNDSGPPKKEGAVKLQSAWLLLLAAALTGCADKPEPVEETRPAKLDPAVIAAWEKAGAKFHWMGVDENGFMKPRLPTLTPNADVMPAFTFIWGCPFKSYSATLSDWEIEKVPQYVGEDRSPPETA